ncbi:MAG: hypothetical protein RBS35_09760 [Azonexus sp.]|nr:hypothetical protein [Azonexus sp.]
MKLPAWLAALFAVFLPACDFVNLPEIKPGITSQAEVRQRMGEPGFVHWSDDGLATWEYSRQPAGKTCYMIRFDRHEIVSSMEQVLTPANFAKAQPGMTRDEIRQLYGQPARKQVFANLGEEIWEWHIEGEFPLEETYFMVHFDLSHGAVKKAGQRIQPKP